MFRDVPAENYTEMKHLDTRSYRDIKPENGTSYPEATEFWIKEFNRVEEDSVKVGGSYKEVKANSDGQKEEVHHMPADCASDLKTIDGPAIKMLKEDHRQTASCGASLAAREYQTEQRRLIENGDFRAALEMDIDDIHEKFGNKYDTEISQLLEYVDELEAEGKI